MKFLKTLLWVIIAVLLGILAARNWRDVTINLWGDLLVDIKIPILLAIMLLIGFLPTWLVYRARVWRGARREQVQAPPPPVPAARDADEAA